MTVEQNSTSVQEPEDLSQIIKIDEAKVSSHLGDLVRRTVEETLNGMLDAEAQELCQAGRYERSEARQNSRAGFYPRKLQTQAGEVKLHVPKLRQAKFETAIIDLTHPPKLVPLTMLGFPCKRLWNCRRNHEEETVQ